MLIGYSKNPLKRLWGILYWNWKSVFLFAFLHTGVWFVYTILEFEEIALPVIPVTILGGGLAIFLGFQNNAAYDRWWEARKVWGGIVNYSRTWGMQVMSLPSTKFSNGAVTEDQLKAWKKEAIYRHIAWMNAFTTTLYEKDSWDKLEGLMPSEELERIKKQNNKPTQILNNQGLRLSYACDNRYVEDFRHMAMIKTIETLYDLQGKAERIKNTVFPYYYNYFTRIFLWLFIITMPFALITDMGWTCIPLGTAILFVFYILEKSGRITEVPFSKRAADTPILSIARNIEIDMREMLGETDLPPKIPVTVGRFGVVFIR